MKEMVNIPALPRLSGLVFLSAALIVLALTAPLLALWSFRRTQGHWPDAQRIWTLYAIGQAGLAIGLLGVTLGRLVTAEPALTVLMWASGAAIIAATIAYFSWGVLVINRSRRYYVELRDRFTPSEP